MRGPVSPILTSLGLTIVAAISCKNEPYRCSIGIEYSQANQIDCTRYVYCSSGYPTYYQCKRRYVYNYCQQKCIPIFKGSVKDECFNAPDIHCVIQKERIYDPYQAENDLSVSGPDAVSSINSISNTQNPYGFGAQGQNMGYGILSGMFGFNMNVNYQPMVGWGFNSNLGVQTPWFTFIPYTNSYPMTFQNTYISPYFPSSWNSRSEDQNAVRVSSCIPNESWPLITTSSPYPPTSISPSS